MVSPSCDAESDGASAPPPSERRIKLAAAGVSVAFYAALVGVVVLDPEAGEVLRKAFGAQPLGVPVVAAVILVQTALFVPVPWITFHAMRIMIQALREGRGAGKLDLLHFVLTVRRQHPHLATSGRIVIGGLVYVIALLVTWIAYAAYLGI